MQEMDGIHTAKSKAIAAPQERKSFSPGAEALGSWTNEVSAAGAAQNCAPAMPPRAECRQIAYVRSR